MSIGAVEAPCVAALVVEGTSSCLVFSCVVDILLKYLQEEVVLGSELDVALVLIYA